MSYIPLPASHRIDKLIDAVHGDRLRRMYSMREPDRHDLEFLESITKERFGSAFEAASQADAIVFQGEGSIGPSNHFRSLRVFSLPVLAAHLWKKPVISMNQSLFASSPADSTALAAIFAGFDVVAVREMASYQFAKEIGIDGVLLCPDMAFLRADDESPSPAPMPDAPYFCVTGSAAIKHYGGDGLSNLVLAITEKFALKPVFLSSRRLDWMHLGETLADSAVIELSSDAYPDFTQLLPLLRSAKFVIGGRYHTAVSALSQGTPVVLLPGNTFKSEGVGPMLGLDCPVMDPGDVSGILSRVEHLQAHQADVRRQIHAAISKCDAAFYSFASYLAQFLDHRLLSNPARPVAAAVLSPARGSQITQEKFRRIYYDKNVVAKKSLPIVDNLLLHKLRRGAAYKEEMERTLTELP